MGPATIDVRDMLVLESSLALVEGDNLHVSDIPDTAGVPEQCVGIWDAGGEPRVGLTALDQERPMIQVRVRGRRGGYEAARALMSAIIDALAGTAQAGTEINGARYVGLWLQGEVVSLGRDGKGRDELSATFRAWRKAV